MKRVKNNTNASDIWVGQQIAPDAFYDIQLHELTAWAHNDKVLQDIVNGYLLVYLDEQVMSTAAKAIALLQDAAPKEVITQFEKNDKNLKIASATAQVDVNTGEVTLDLITPTGGRWIASGEAFFSESEPIRITAVVGVASIDLPADALYPGSPALTAGDTIKNYHDEYMPEPQQGWRLPTNPVDYKSIGTAFIETIAGYGFVPDIVTLRVKAKKPGSAPFSGWFTVNLNWAENG